jgi:regulator of protease activity HflC (stomatin/prohibitin superfamily)
MTLRVTFLVGGIAMIAGCAEPPPPRSVQEFLDNPIVLEAALVRCSRDREETRYDAECVNAREANRTVTAKEVAERRAELEAQSERKRQALRREQQAAAEARRRAAEAEKLREEAAYLAQFGELPPDDGQEPERPETGNLPTAVVPEPARNLDEVREELKRRNEE